MLHNYHEISAGDRRTSGRRFYWTAQAMETFEILRPLQPFTTREALVSAIESVAKQGGRKAVGRLDIELYFDVKGN